MSDDSKSDPLSGAIPNIVQAMLQPYRRVSGGNMENQPTSFEITFISDDSRPNDAQLAAIGAVAWEWSILEYHLEVILARLALAPDFPTRAVTNNLAIDNRLSAIKSLLALHRERYRHRIVSEKLDEAIISMMPRVAALKGKRNTIVHRVWMRFGDEMHAFRFNAATPSAIQAAEVQSKRIYTTEELRQVARDIRDAADTLFMLSQLLPAVDEGQQLKSLEQEARRLRSEEK
ncbi:MAG TPA: hypothetical protein PK585_06520 [Amphiplicatus sp.]|nr:hypothetical protein [Amphiplicatus sp.]